MSGITIVRINNLSLSMNIDMNIDTQPIQDINIEFNDYRTKQQICSKKYQELDKILTSNTEKQNPLIREQFNITCHNKNKANEIFQLKLNKFFYVFYISNKIYGIYFNNYNDLYYSDIINYLESNKVDYNYSCISEIEEEFDVFYKSIIFFK